MVVGETAGVRAHLHVGDLELDGLVRADRLAERHPGAGVCHRLVDASLRQADRQGRDRDAALVEDREELRVAAAALPNRFARGTRQSTNDSSRVSDALHPTLEYFLATVKPGVSTGTKMAEISFRPFASCPVTAVTVTSRVMSVPPLVIKALVPLITHSSPSITAVVRVAPASDPPSGSVRPNAPNAWPEHSAGSQLRFCSSVP